MTESRNSVESDLSLAYLREDELGKFRSGKRVFHVAAACREPYLACIYVNELLDFQVILEDLDLIGTARLVNRLKTDKEASVLLGSASACRDLFSVLEERCPDHTGLIRIAKHTKLCAPLEDHLIFKNAVKCNCHTFLFYQIIKENAHKVVHHDQSIADDYKETVRHRVRKPKQLVNSILIKGQPNIVLQNTTA